jgi:hypothetical protein
LSFLLVFLLGAAHAADGTGAPDTGATERRARPPVDASGDFPGCDRWQRSDYETCGGGLQRIPAGMSYADAVARAARRAELPGPQPDSRVTFSPPACIWSDRPVD